MTTRAPVTEHRINVDEQDTQARAWCSCGWSSDWYWSRRRAGEAGRGHLHTSVPPPTAAQRSSYASPGRRGSSPCSATGAQVASLPVATRAA